MLAWTCNGVDYALDREITVANETINCVAKLKEPEPEVLETYTITYKDIAENGEESEITGLTPNTYTKQDSVTYPTQITYTHQGDTRHTYEFAGWSTNSDLSDTTYGFTSGRTGDITLYATWNIVTPQGNVVYDCGNKRKITRTDYVGFNVLPATAEECRITLDTLIGWTCDGVDYATDEYMTVKAGTTTCVANIEMDEYNLIYNVNGGTWSDNSNVKTTYTRLDSFALSTDITKPNYDFVGWYLSPEFNNVITNIVSGTMHDTTVYANWTPKIVKCEPGYYLPSGTIVCKECDERNKYCPGDYYEYSETNESGKEKCPDDYPFADMGAVSVDDCYTNCPNREHYTVSGNMKRYTNSCVYTPIIYHINYVKNGGEFESGANVVYEYTVDSEFITPLPELKQTGKTFVGWFDVNGTNITGIDTSLATDITLYARWVDTPCHEDYYKASDGSCVICPSHGYSDGGFTTSCSCDDGYYWNSETKECLYDYEQVYTITYYLDGGNATNPTSYNVETPTWTLNNPTKENYDFIGWCETENCSNPALTYTIEQGTIGDKTLYAVWEKSAPTQFECAAGKYLYVDENTVECKNCPIGYYCPHGVWTVETADDSKTPCPHGKTTENEGAASESECRVVCPSGKYMRIGENESDKLCLYEEQQTHPALAIRVNGKTYYANMGQRNLTINAETTKKMRVEYMGHIYNVYDANME